MTIAELKSIISKFRAIVESDSITPESLGAILQQISEFAAQTPDLSSLDGQPNGLPLLDAQAMIKPEVIPAQFKDIPFFNGSRTVGSLMEVPPELPSSGQVVFSESHKTFVFLVGGLCYPDWKDADKWGIASTSGRKPYLDKLYFNPIRSEFNVGDPTDGLKLLPIHSVVNSLNEWSQSLSTLQEQHDQLVEWNSKYGAYEYEISITQAEPGDEPAVDEDGGDEPAWVVDNTASLIPLVNLLRAGKHVNLFAKFPSNVGFSQSSLRIPAQSFYVNGDSYFFSFNVDDNIFILEVSNTAPELHSITVLRSGLLESIISLESRVDILDKSKKQLFIDMWKGLYEGCEYDEEEESFSVKYFDANGAVIHEVKNITYEEALAIYKWGTWGEHTCLFKLNAGEISKSPDIRCTIPSNYEGVYNKLYLYDQIEWYWSPSKLEALKYLKGNSIAFIKKNLHIINRNLKGIFDKICPDADNLRIGYASDGYNENLTTLYIHNLKYKLSLQFLKRLSLDTFKYLVENASNTTPIIVTVHADVFAKMTGDASNQAAAALQPEEAAQWQKLFNDAADRQISFATA